MRISFIFSGHLTTDIAKVTAMPDCIDVNVEEQGENVLLKYPANEQVLTKEAFIEALKLGVFTVSLSDSIQNCDDYEVDINEFEDESDD